MSTAPPERPFRLVVNVPVALVQQYDALAVARGITRGRIPDFPEQCVGKDGL